MASVSIKNAESIVIEPYSLYFKQSGQLTENERKCLEIQSPEELSKSKFDLPIEFHLKEYELFLSETTKVRSRRNLQSLIKHNHNNFGKYILSQKTSIMYLCEAQRPNRDSRFERLKSECLRKALEQRPSFSAIRTMAIQLLRSNTLQKLQIIAENEFCPNIQDTKHKLFSWSADDYYKRRELQNTLWLDAYERNYKDCLQSLKFKCDLQEIRRYLDIILCGALSEAEDFSFEYEVVHPLEDASDLLSVYERLKSELQENRGYIEVLKRQYAYAESMSYNFDVETRLNISQQMADVNILYPIKFRYQKGWYDAQVDQVELEQEQNLKKLNDNITNWHYEIEQQNSAIQNTLNIYYSLIEYYKAQTNEFSAKFESEYDDLENAINYKRMSMTKNEVQRKQCEEHIDFMREKVAQYHAMKKREEEERRRLAQEQAEAELIKLVKAEEKRLKKEENLKNKKQKRKN